MKNSTKNSIKLGTFKIPFTKNYEYLHLKEQEKYLEKLDSREKRDQPTGLLNNKSASKKISLREKIILDFLLTNKIAEAPIEILANAKFARRGKNTKKKLYDSQESVTARLFNLIESCKKQDRYYNEKLTYDQRKNLTLELKKAGLSENVNIHTDYNIIKRGRNLNYLKNIPLSKIGFYFNVHKILCSTTKKW